MVASLAGLQGMETGVLVLLATTVWGVGTGAYGLFLAVGAVGGLLGSLAANRLVRRFKSAQTLIAAGHRLRRGLPGHGRGEGMATGRPRPSRWSASPPARGGRVHRPAPAADAPEAMGRVGAASRGIVWGAAPVGALLAGTLASLAGLRLPLVLAGALAVRRGRGPGPPSPQSLREDAPVPLRPTR